MKITGLSKHPKYSIYESVTVEVPLDLAIQKKIINWNLNSTKYALRDIRLKSGEVVNGLLVYSDINKFIDFLLTQYVPENNTVWDNTLRSPELTNKQKRVILMEQLFQMNYYEDRHRFLTGSGKTINFVYEEQELFGEHEFVHLNIEGRKILFHGNVGKGRKRMIYTENKSDWFGTEINKYTFILECPETSNVFYWDGKKLEIFNVNLLGQKHDAIKTIGKEAFDMFDRFGSIKCTQDWRDFMPPKDFAPEYLVKIPAISEFNFTALPDSEIPEDYKKPMFVFDMRGIIRTNKNVPVINDPVTAGNLLSRVTRNIYNPYDDAVYRNARKYIELKPYYCAFGKIT